MAMENEEMTVGSETNLYEIGYLLSPLVPIEEVASAIDKTFRMPIESLGGEVASQLMPFLRPLAYAVVKSVGSKRSSYKDAYFGAMRFDLKADQVEALNKMIEKSELVLRYILIRLPKSADRVITTGYRKPVIRREHSLEKIIKDEVVAEKGEMNEEQIDKEIEGLLEEKVVA